MRASAGLAGALLAAFAATVYTISFAAVAYGGDLAPFLDRGIGLALIGSAAATATAGLLASTRGIITHAQDSTMFLLASATPTLVAAAAVAGVAPGSEAQFATFVAFLACTTGLTGLVLIAAGRLRLSFVARYLPFPVLAGVVVSVGYLLSISSVSIALERSVDLYSLPAALADGGFARWAPWAAGAVALLVGRRYLPERALLPIGLILAFVAFHVFLRATGSSLSDARDAGLLLGPFPKGGFLEGLSPGLIGQVEWGAVLPNLTIVAALAPLAALNAVIHLQAICQTTDQEPDLDSDLAAIGVANIAGATSGGLIAYPSLSASLLAAQFGTPSVLAWGAAAALCLGVAAFGADLLGTLPYGILAMLVLYLGLDMLITWCVTELRRLPLRDLVPMLAIPATTALVGLLPGLALGVALSLILFVVSYARLPFIRTESTLARRRSIVERGEQHRLALSDAGDRVRILEVTGYLFFGTATELRQRVQALTGPDGPGADSLVLDFRGVRDIDASAIDSLDRTQRECRARGITLYISGLRNEVADRLHRFGFGGGEALPGQMHRFEALDDALQSIEDDIISRRFGPDDGASETFLAELAAAVPGIDLAEIFTTVSTADGATIIDEGDASDEIFVLLEGRAAAVLGAHGDTPLVVARFEPGALIGEMAYYQDARRSASVVSEGAARLLRIDARSLSPGGGLPEALVSAFHRIAARQLSQRLERATRLLRDARL